jgi:hypothetical protein
MLQGTHHIKSKGSCRISDSMFNGGNFFLWFKAQKVFLLKDPRPGLPKNIGKSDMSSLILTSS